MVGIFQTYHLHLVYVLTKNESPPFCCILLQAQHKHMYEKLGCQLPLQPFYFPVPETPTQLTAPVHQQKT